MLHYVKVLLTTLRARIELQNRSLAAAQKLGGRKKWNAVCSHHPAVPCGRPDMHSAWLLLSCLALAFHALHIQAAASQPSGDLPLVFLHIPKTGGTSVLAALWEKYSTECTPLDFLSIVKQGFPKGMGDCIMVHLHAGPRPGEDERALFHRLATAGLLPRPVRFLAGHVPYGFCTFLDRGCRYAAVLRHPVSRIISHYGYLKLRHPQILRRLCSNCSTLDGFAVELAAGRIRNQMHYGLYNMQTRMVAGDAFWATVTGSVVCIQHMAGCDIAAEAEYDARMMRTALENLNTFSMLGVLEDLPAFYRQAGLKDPGRLNKGLSYAAISNTTWNLLARTQQMDMELYEAALMLIKQKASERRAVL